MRRAPSRIPLALAFFIALSGACGGDDDEAVPAESTTEPGPSVPQPPQGRSLVAEGSVEITPATGDVATGTIATKVVSNDIYNGDESGFELHILCGQTVADVEVALYFAYERETHVVELRNDRWTVDRSVAEVVPAKPTANDVDAGSGADAGADAETDAGADAGADAGSDAAVPPTTDPSFVNGVGFPGVDGRREIKVTLAKDGVRYDIHATVPWLKSVAPNVCQKTVPGTGSKSSSGGGCGGGSSKSSSHHDWD